MTVAAVGLTVLAVDDEPPALDELAYLLRADPRVAEVRTAGDAMTALQELEATPVDAVFLDIRMPGLSGLDLARVLARFAQPPAIVFVTAHEGAAVDAFALRAVDYLLKPVRSDRLSDALDRITPAAPPAGHDDETIPVELGGVTRFVTIADVLFVEAQGDYARLHTAEGSHLVRIAMATLEQRWAARGFVRVHRSFLVAAAHITELRVEPGGGNAVCIGSGPHAATIPVSRRHTRELKDRLVRRARESRA
ncbi:MAG: two component transcriptional regulator, LytTR family [Frankiales bacterium]|nr:two component transcriptional regulator, LytTR family [Frankiales bacterium]